MDNFWILSDSWSDVIIKRQIIDRVSGPVADQVWDVVGWQALDQVERWVYDEIN